MRYTDLSFAELEELKDEIVELAKQYDLWHDCGIFANGNMYSADEDSPDGVAIDEQCDLGRYFEDADDRYGILAMYFDDEMYYVLEGRSNDDRPFVEQLSDLLAYRGLHYEVPNPTSMYCQPGKNLTPEERDELKDEIVALAKEHNVWYDCGIFVNGNRYRCDYDSPDGVTVDEGLDPRAYFEYVRDKGNILSMYFEGPMYMAINGYTGDYRFSEELRGILAERGLYYELGNAWNLTCFWI